MTSTKRLLSYPHLYWKLVEVNLFILIYKVLALAHRVLDTKITWHQMHRMKREQMECQLEFLGLLIMHNTLKSETTPVIRQLRNANVRCIMVTGNYFYNQKSLAQ